MPDVNSKLEDKFLRLFLTQFKPELILCQYKSPNMRGKRMMYAYDFYVPVADLLIECNGGIWMGRGAHNTGKAIQRDYDKANKAMLAGYKLLLLDESKINENYCQSAFDYIRECIRTTANKGGSV